MAGAIDLNCDCGESFGAWAMGDDAHVLPHVTSANIACGAHAGDPVVMRRTVQLAKQSGVSAGAHPGFPDLQGFGRRVLHLSPDEVYASVLAQIGALHAMARAEGVALAHVKPHGALYNQAGAMPAIAAAIASAVADFDKKLILVGLAGSALIEAGMHAGLRVACEAFVDRAYEADGSLRPRQLPGAVIEDVQRGLDQALDIALRGEVTTYEGTRLTLRADTLSIHGDTRGAAARARQLRTGLEQAGVTVAPLTAWLAR